MRPRVVQLGCAVLMLMMASAAMATSFVVPTDDEMVAKSQSIVIGTVEGSYVQEVEGIIETVYELRVERGIKGAARAEELISIVSPGGMIGERGLLVPGSAHFRQGDHVLLFLTRHKGRWTTTDLTLGKFRFVTSTLGERLLVRDLEDVVGWDHAGKVHREKVRKEQGFLRFVEERAHGRKADTNYAVEASQVTIAPEPSAQITTNAAPFPAATYTDWVSNQPIRWPNISAGVPFWKRSDTNISGASDGGVSVIQGGLNAWNSECASNINLTYAGQRATASANHDGFNMVEFNDPQQRISGSWSGSGTVGICFTSFSGTHSFNGQTWLNISGADVVFQDGYPATNASFASAMTHELGHGIGWRHSNQDYATGGACNSANQECTSAAIMNSSVSANYGYNLQPWDVHAAESVYPGGTCGPTCTPPSITAQPTSRTITAGTSTTLSVSASGTSPLSYQWYIGASGNTTTPVPGGTGPSITVAPGATTAYWVRVSNACGTVNSGSATVTVNPQPPASRGVIGDYSGDGRADPTIFRPSTGNWHSTAFAVTKWGVNGDRVVPADYDGDRRTDIGVFRPSTGRWYISLRTGGWQEYALGQSGDIPVPGDYNGDGRAEPAVFRPSNGTWYSTSFSATKWGESSDHAVPADYDGDGRTDIAVFRPSTGRWYISLRAGGWREIQWGQSGDVPIPADYNGDGDAEVAVYRPSNGTWYFSENAFATTKWGESSDFAVPADYDGDRRSDICVFRPSTGRWYIQLLAGGWQEVVLGQTGDIPALFAQSR